MKRILKFIGCLALAFAGASVHADVSGELAAKLAAVSPEAPLVSVTEDEWPAATPVVYDGKFYSKIDDAINAACEVNADGPALIYCRPGCSNVRGKDPESHPLLKTSITIYGNGASVGSGWEPSIEGPGADNPANGTHELKKDTALAIYNLNDGAGLWGTRCSDYTVTLTMANCQNAHEVYATYSGTSVGQTFITVKNCTFKDGNGGRTSGWPVNLNSGGSMTVEDCSFSGGTSSITANLKQDGNQVIDVTVKNCSFTDVPGQDGKKGVIRLATEKVGTVNLVAQNLTFSGSRPNSPADITIGDAGSDKVAGTVTYDITGTAGKLRVAKKDESGAVVVGDVIDMVATQRYSDGVSAPAVQIVVEENSVKGITAVVVQEIVANEEVAKVEQAAIAEAIKEEVERKDEAVVKVTLQEVKTEANKTTLQFVVAPYIGAVQVNNDNIKGAVPFRLPLLKEKFVEYAKISHEGDPDRFVLVKKGANGEPYVDVALTHFSKVFASAATEAEMVPEGAVKIQDGLWGANGKTSMTEAEIVYIVGATGLKAFRDWANGGTGTEGTVFGSGKTFILVADVDLQGSDENLWTPAGKHDTNMFAGTFDGNGKSIQNLYAKGSHVGLFTEITEGGCIKNLTIASGKVVANAANKGAGSVVGYMTGGRIENVTNYAEVAAIGTYGRVGGIVGVQGDDHGIGEISNCVNYGKVWQESGLTSAGSGGHLGGIVGQCMYKLKVFSCKNYGDITADLATINVGGIIGNAKCDQNSDFPEEVFTLENCVNYAMVTTAGGGNIGGVICNFKNGVQGHGTPTKVGATFGNCANYGELVGSPSSTGAKAGFVEMQWGASKVKLTGPVSVRKGQSFSNHELASAVWDPRPVAMCPGVAKDINGNDIDVDTYYLSIADAIAAAKAGDTVKLVSASSEDFTLPAGVTFDASKATYTGTISAPEGYFVKEISTKVYECRPAVAQIGTKIYSSLKEAYDASVDGDTIKMLVDFALTEEFKLGSVDRNNLIIDLNGKKMTLYSVVSTQYKNLTFENGAIDIGVPAGGRAGEHAWSKLFYAETCELKFDNIQLTYTNGVSAVGISTGGGAKLTFKDCTLNFANCDKPISLGTTGDIVFDHTVIDADKATTYIAHGEDACGPVIFKNGSSVTMKDCGGLNSNGTVEMSDTTVNATGLKNPLFRNSSVTLVSNAKIFVDGATNMFGYNAWELVVNAGCTFDVRNCGYTGAIFNRGGSVFKSGSTVVISNCCVTENTTHACYGKDNAIRAYGDLTIEDGADVRLYGTIDAFSGPGTITIADGRYTKLVQSVATEKFDLKGGIYHDEPDDAFVNEAYKKVANEDPNTKDAYPTRVQAKPSVASYETEDGVVNTYLLEKAVELVMVGGTITLLAPNAESFTTTRTEPFTLVTSEGKAFTGKITMPNGYALKDNGDGTYSYYKMPIATITREGVTTEYDSLPAACTAAQDGDTIVLSPMIIDATSETAIAGLNNKRVVVKGAGMDVTTLNWGTGKKTGPSGADFGTAEIMFQDLAFTVDHANGEPYKDHFKPMASLAFKGVKVNGMLVVDNDATFDGCTFTGPRYNSKTAADDEYLLWLYKGKLTVMNCTFPGTGTHAPIKLYSEPTMPDNVCALDISNCTFAVVGDQNGAIVSSCKHTTPKYAKDQVYDVQIDTDSITIPDGAYYVGLESGQWAAKGVTIINGTKDKNGKYVSGVVFSSVGEDTDINRIVNLFIGPDSACLPYVGPETNLADFSWYIGDKQLTPKTDNVEVGGLPENPPQEMKDQVAADTNNVIKTLSGDDITKFADTDVAGSSFNADGNPKDVVKQTLIDAANEQSVKDAIAAQLGESNSNERVEIKLDKFDFTVQEASATLSVVEYDVKPWIKVTTVVDNVEKVTEAVIPNEALAGHPLTFRLAVNSNFVNYAKVVHKDGDTVRETYLTEVFTGSTGKYVQLKSDHFSNFSVSANVSEPKCKVGDQFYNSVQEAIEENADVPDAVFMLTAKCSETGLALKWGQVIDVNGQEFSGAINPVDPEGHPAEETYEQAKTPDGLVFSAPKKIEVPTSPEAGAPKIKVRIAGKTADQLKAIQETSKRPLWADIVMGTTEKLIPFVPRSPIGSGTVTIKTTLPDETFVRTAVTARDGVSVKYQLKKRVGNGDFLEYGEVKEDIPVFTVDAAALEARTSWKIETIFDEEY